ncbi:MAG: mechanosensitive ion channel domain-containing protein [Haloferacaceae archaeon]
MLQTGLGPLRRLLDTVPFRLWAAAFVLLAGVFLAYVVRRVTVGALRRAGVPELIEGTAFERTAREFDSSTVTIFGWLMAYLTLAVVVFAALSIVGATYVAQFWSGVASFLPRLFVALLVVLVGLIVGDKAELLVADRLKGVKLPQTGALPTAVKYSVFYVAALVALSQIGVETLSLVVLLAAYVVAVVVVAVVAFHTMLTSAAAGVYLLLNEPYGIGDEVRIDGNGGVVQEIDLFVTHVESDGEEYIIPNAKLFREGVVRVRS